MIKNPSVNHPEVLRLRSYLSRLRNEKTLREYHNTLNSWGLEPREKLILERYFGANPISVEKVLLRRDRDSLDKIMLAFLGASESEGNMISPLRWQKGNVGGVMCDLQDNLPLVEKLRRYMATVSQDKQSLESYSATISQWGLGKKEEEVLITYFGVVPVNIGDAPKEDVLLIQRILGAYWRTEQEEALLNHKRQRRADVKRITKPKIKKESELREVPPELDISNLYNKKDLAVFLVALRAEGADVYHDTLSGWGITDYGFGVLNTYFGPDSKDFCKATDSEKVLIDKTVGLFGIYALLSWSKSFSPNLGDIEDMSDLERALVCRTLDFFSDPVHSEE